MTDPECVTCILDTTEGHCGWVTIRRNCNGCDKMTYFASCGGYNTPQTYKTAVGQDFDSTIEWTIMESNTALADYRAGMNIPTTEYGIWHNEKYNTVHNYEVYKPVDFDSSGTKKYAVFLEVYAGIEFQKVEHRYKGYSSQWPQVREIDHIIKPEITFVSFPIFSHFPIF